MTAPLATGFRPQVLAERGVAATEHPLAAALALEAAADPRREGYAVGG